MIMSAPESGHRGFAARLAAFNVEYLFSQKRPPGPPRTVYVNKSIPGHYLDHKGRIKPEFVYKSNQVITSKYTIITFLPRNLLEQFRRIANMYVLYLVCIYAYTIRNPQIFLGDCNPSILP
jgi:phospholipid-translocating ATPase